MPTQQTTSTQAAALGYAPQNKVSVLCDGSIIWVEESGTSTNTNKLYQIASPGGGSPSSTQVTGFVSTITSAIQSVSDIFVLNNGTTTSDVWVLTGGQAGAAGVRIQHVVYTASGSSWGTWDTSTTVSGVSTTTGNIVSVVWTGTYLIAAWRDVSGSTFTIHANWTTDKTGVTGWQASSIKLNGDAGSASHHYIQLFYDSTLAATVAVMAQETGANGTEFITSRVLSDAFTPALANWGPETSAGLTGLNFGSANFTSTIDHTTGKVHVAWCDSTASNTKSPGYIPATVTVDAVTVANNKLTWGTAIAVGTAAIANAQPSLTIDGSGTVYLFWETAAVNATGNIAYATIASPYTAASSVTNLTSTGANYYPHVPNRQRVTAGYIPLIYQTGTASPYGIQYDNSITASTGSTAYTPQGTETVTAADAVSRLTVYGRQTTETATVAASASVVKILIRTASEALGVVDSVVRSAVYGRQGGETATSADVGSRTAVMTRTDTETVTISDSAVVTKNGTATFYSDTTKTTSWTSPSSSSDTETDIIAKNTSGDGFQFGSNPSYGGTPFSALYEIVASAVVNSGQNAVNPGSQLSMSTSVPDGHLHVLSNTTTITDGSFGGSEDKTFTLTEQAPTQTALRRYLKSSTVTVNGIQYTIWACVYPGSTGPIAWRVDVVAASNTSFTAAGTNDNIEICSPAGLLSNTGAGTSQGVWNVDSTHAYIGTVGVGTAANAVNNSAVNTGTNITEPDLLAFLPVQNVGSLTNQKLGLMSVKFTKWADVGLTALGSAALQNTNRVKAKWGGNAGTTLTAGTYTFYLLETIRQNLTTSEMTAIAADYLLPGAPTAGTGTLTTFNYPNHTGHKFNLDEACYVVDCAANQASLTLDFPTNVTTRYQPRYKFTNYQVSGKPIVQWGSTRLTESVDYNVVVDATNHICYLHLQRDIVSSGATGSQLNNAALSIQSSWFLGLTETLGVSDTVNRAVVYLRTGTEIAATVDSNGRTVLYTRTDAESLATVDVGNRAVVALRQAIDTVASADVTQRSVGYLRAGAETVTTSDTAQRVAQYIRQTLETTGITDAASRLVGYSRQSTETASSADTGSRLVAYVRSLADTVTSSDAVSRRVQYLRQAIETVTTSDVVQALKNGGGTAWTAAVTETLAITDAVSRLVGYKRQDAETTTTVDSSSRIFGLIRSGIETVATSDTVTRSVVMLRQAVETAGITDAASRSVAYGRQRVETVATSDTAQRIKGVTASVTESVGSSDTLKRVGTWVRSAADTLGLSDVVSAILNAFNRSAPPGIVITVTCDIPTVACSVDLPIITVDITS